MRKQEIVILHGWNLSGERFSPLVSLLHKKGYRVFAPDLPGFGKEPPPDKPWHVVNYAEFLKTYCDRNHLQCPIVIGHSFGGRVGLKFAQLYPDGLCALILTGTPGFSPVAKKKMLFFLVVAKIGSLIFALPPLNIFSDWARRWLYYAAGARDFFRAEGSMRQTFKYVVQDDLVAAMESIRLPCLLLWGEYDVIVPKDIAYRMQETIPNATIKIISEHGHGVPFQAPEVFAQYVEEYVRQMKL